MYQRAFTARKVALRHARHGPMSGLCTETWNNQPTSGLRKRDSESSKEKGTLEPPDDIAGLTTRPWRFTPCATTHKGSSLQVDWTALYYTCLYNPNRLGIFSEWCAEGLRRVDCQIIVSTPGEVVYTRYWQYYSDREHNLRSMLTSEPKRILYKIQCRQH